LATGGVVRQLPWNVEGVIYYRTLDDYYQLREAANTRTSFVVIGGGFIGSEISAALAMNGRSVTMVFPETAVGSRLYPRGLSLFLNSYYTSKNVELCPNDTVVNIEKQQQKYIVTTSSGKTLETDGVVAGLGIQPNTLLAQNAGLTVENGIIVNEFLQTSHPDIYAAGDVANFHNPMLEKRLRVEHEDNALTMGEYAGRNMAGDPVRYHHLPFFYSDLFDLGYEAIGEIDARLEMFEDWKDPYREGVVYYINARRIRGVLLWNTWGQVEKARTLIGEHSQFDQLSIKGLIPA
jgi:NADPH-dependent 2,4-dienoyl-CoA reductase/sulfur reductase-like enzyme